MRVYEFAKKNDISSKEALALLEKKGISLASHMSVLSEEAINILNAALSKGKKKESSSEKKVAVPLTPPVQSRAAVGKKVIEKPKVSTEKVSIAPRKNVSVRRIPSRGRRGADREKNISKKVTEITLEGPLPLFQVADLMGRPMGEIILALLKKGIACNKNKVLSVEKISDLAHGFGIAVTVSKVLKATLEESRLGVEEVMAGGKDLRWPIVVVMGHVDHGKTTLLDRIRNMNTAAKESGGITQHLSAYEVDSVHGKIVFLDTPGHEAFSYMRKRGASITDIVILVIAADDGVMPQTVEVIKHAKSADVPILVAINKVDKVDSEAALEKVKRQLAQHDLLPEDWGGDVICVPISAKTGKGVEELLEMVVLQAQMMELKADKDATARAFVLETKQERGFGFVATVISLSGTLKVGDCFVCGSSTGKVRLLVDSHGKRIACAGPAVPVQVVGFDNFVALGDWLTVVSADEYLREKSARKKLSCASDRSDDLSLATGPAKKQEILLIIKTDTQGSREAIVGVINKVVRLHSEIPCSFRIIFCGTGDVSERDIDLASHSGAYIIALHVKVEKKAQVFAKEQNVDVHEFAIIYKMAEFLEELLKEREEDVIVRKKTGEAVVRKVFDLKKRGTIAGCYISDGVFARGNVVVCLRNGEKIGEAVIDSLQRERKVVKEVHKGYECGFITDSFHEWEVGDTVHCFKEEKKKRSSI